MSTPQTFPFSRLIRHLRENPSAILLFVQLAGVLLYPLMQETPGGRALFNVFGLVVLGAALRMVRRSPAATWVAVLLATAVGSLLLVELLVVKHPVLPAVTAGLEALFYLYAAAGLIAYMMEDQLATTDELFAAGATFTLLAWAFAHLFTVCQALVPGSFHPDATQLRSWMDLLFLSFTTISGVGLGDIVPLTPMGKALIMLAEFTGVMYLALVVSRLISMKARPSASG